MDPKKHVEWAKHYNKIGCHRVFSREDELLTQVMADLNNTKPKELSPIAVSNRIVSTEQENVLGISMFAGVEPNRSTRDLTEEKVAFVWFQILTEILVQMPQLPTARNEMLDEWRQACRTGHDETNIIKDFCLNYNPTKALYWYTRNTHLYKLLNKALRTENIDNIYKFRFFIVDLYRQLNELFQYSIPMNHVLIVYRGQRMTIREVENLCRNHHGLISMNSFISTSVNKKITQGFLAVLKKEEQEKTVAVLFKMTISANIAQQTNKPFADIRKFSSFPKEEEILLSMGTIFRIDKIEQNSSDSFYFELTMCMGNTDPQHKALYDYAKEEIACAKKMSYSTYGKFLALMSNFDSSIAYYRQVLSLVPDQLQLNEIDLATIHNDFAYAYRDSHRYQEALKHYEIALKLRLKQGSTHEEDLATTYSDFGWLLMNMNDIQKALDFHQRALNIRERILGHNNVDTAMSYNCIGLAAAYTGDFDRASTCLNEALAIRQRCLTACHPYTAMSYSSLGSYYEALSEHFQKQNMRDKALEYYSRALDMHKQALSIYKTSVPPTHGILGTTYASVGSIYLNQEQWPEAIEHLTACATIRRKQGSSNLAYTLNRLGQAYSGKGEYQRAITVYQEALTVAQKNDNKTLVTQLKTNIEKCKQNLS
ncbi:unnamed protein product [Rotaria sordida]|uniref:ADP ribosyltransferase domain-containing protein n=1 Tax=Rotaria sordida TaxID=392033 RepID=A0A818RBY1_9BILA|nr:unnamed protein product [Rotaria sordida]CAF3648973.1 unnamed protein product [Rotaria sordida]